VVGTGRVMRVWGNTPPHNAGGLMAIFDTRGLLGENHVNRFCYRWQQVQSRPTGTPPAFS